MIINWGRKTVKLSEGTTQHCQKCDAEKPFSIFLQYKVFGLLWIFLTSWSKVYTYRCDTCSEGWELQGEAKTKVENAVSRLGKSPIPFLRRFGLWLFLGITMPLGMYFDYSDNKHWEETDTYNDRGLAYHNKGDYDKAILEYTKAIELDSGAAKAYSNRGVAYCNKEDYGRAITDFTRAIELDPDIAPSL